MWLQTDRTPESLTGPSPTGRTVLVVEDETLVRMLVVQMLEDAGHSVLECAEGGSALETLKSDQPIDILVTDVGLPGVSGRRLAEQARARRPDLKVLFMTGYTENAVGDDLVLPDSDLIAKPFALEQLAAKIDRMLRVEA